MGLCDQVSADNLMTDLQKCSKSRSVCYTSFLSIPLYLIGNQYGNTRPILQKKSHQKPPLKS